MIIHRLKFSAAQLCVGLILAVSITCEGIVTSNGDVRLVSSGQSINEWKGTLEVYLNGDWGVVCSLGFTDGAADAACREIGRTEHISWSTVEEMNEPVNETREILMSNVNCPSTSNPVKDAQLHLLRCNYTNVNSSCKHTNSVWLHCNSTGLNFAPYNTQIFLFNTDIDKPVTPSSGALQIETNGSFSSVCYSAFSQLVANTVCKQLGFTNALEYSSILNHTIGEVYPAGDDLNCSTTNNCLHQCYDSDEVPSKKCQNFLFVYIRCTFNTTIAAKNPPGSFDQCNVSLVTPFNVYILIGAMVLVSIILAGVVTIVIVVCCFVTQCPLYARRKRKAYRGIV